MEKFKNLLITLSRLVSSTIVVSWVFNLFLKIVDNDILNILIIPSLAILIVTNKSIKFKLTKNKKRI